MSRELRNTDGFVRPPVVGSLPRSRYHIAGVSKRIGRGAAISYCKIGRSIMVTCDPSLLQQQQPQQRFFCIALNQTQKEGTPRHPSQAERKGEGDT